jgi:hypothetical protein
MRSLALFAFSLGLTTGLAAPAWARGVYAGGAAVVQHVLDSYLVLFLTLESVRLGCFL